MRLWACRESSDHGVPQIDGRRCDAIEEEGSVGEIGGLRECEALEEFGEEEGVLWEATSDEDGMNVLKIVEGYVFVFVLVMQGKEGVT